jgi:dipeptidyl aminopeptidase/acylaminoacyl peptidase
MAVVTRRPVLAPAFPWRTLGVLALLAILIAATVIAFVGSQARLPAPFGTARNGLIAFDASGDIFTADPVTGAATTIVASPETEIGPRYSRDGTHIVFARTVDSVRSQLYVVRSDGSDLTLITPEPLVLTPSQLGEPWEQYQFSPDGASVLIAVTDRGYPEIVVARSDGTGLQTIDVGMPAFEPSYRPPDGREILFVGNPGLGSGQGVYVVDRSTGARRTLVAPRVGYDLAGANWSPDGSQVAYWTWGGPLSESGITAHTHVVAAAGTGDRELGAPTGTVWTAGSDWSNDGTRLFILRGFTPDYEDVRPAIVRVDGRSPDVEVDRRIDMIRDCCAFFEWAPDDSMILGTPAGLHGVPEQQVIIDPVTGQIQVAPWASTSDPAWQRLAP